MMEWRGYSSLCERYSLGGRFSILSALNPDWPLRMDEMFINFLSFRSRIRMHLGDFLFTQYTRLSQESTYHAFKQLEFGRYINQAYCIDLRIQASQTYHKRSF